MKLFILQEASDHVESSKRRSNKKRGKTTDSQTRRSPGTSMPTPVAPTMGGRDYANDVISPQSGRRDNHNDDGDEAAAANPMRGWGGLAEALSPPRNNVNNNNDDATLKTMTMTPQLDIPSFLKKAKPKKAAATPVWLCGIIE